MSVLGGQGRHRPALPAASRMLAAPSRMLTQGGALLRAQGAPGLLLLVLEAAAVIKLEVVLYREALQETTDRPALALRAHRGQLSQEGEGEGWALAACPGAGTLPAGWQPCASPCSPSCPPPGWPWHCGVTERWTGPRSSAVGGRLEGLG